LDDSLSVFLIPIVFGIFYFFALVVLFKVVNPFFCDFFPFLFKALNTCTFGLARSYVSVLAWESGEVKGCASRFGFGTGFGEIVVVHGYLGT
jgi:hypothetical protein